ncbi:MAG TPA: type II toxin-antitoxin system VapC family toxin [Nitrospira sp.]|nr:type II toxin-antitoxin system VapC family toxin [Nitrospira sp.]
MIVVPDASVILKWVLEKDTEPGYSQAAMLQEALLAETIEIRIPTLWRYEVGNVLGLKKPRMAMELMSALLAYEFEEIPLRTEYALDVLKHMQDVPGVTFYDAAYHVLALRTKGLYVTADNIYVRRAKDKGHVTLLKEWQGP